MIFKRLAVLFYCFCKVLCFTQKFDDMKKKKIQYFVKLRFTKKKIYSVILFKYLLPEKSNLTLKCKVCNLLEIAVGIYMIGKSNCLL